MKHMAVISMQNGKVVNRKPLATIIESLKDGKYLVEINSYNHRSNQQNRYYWGLVIPLIQKGIKDMGTEITKEETHEFLKARFNYEEIVNKGTGEYVTIPRSTTALNKEQFSEYIEKIQQFASEFLNIVIPDPGQQTVIQYD